MVPSAVSQWCQRLVEFHEKDSSCHDSATTSVTYGSSAGGVCRCSVPRASTGSDIAGMGLGEQQPTFLSRSGVDWWLWTNHARFLRTPGAIIDLTVPQENYTLPEGSASYFLEHCMRWTGVCSPTTKGFRTCSPKSSVSPYAATSTASGRSFGGGLVMALNTAVGGATGRGDELKLSTKSFFERFSWPDMILASPFHATMDSFLVDKRGYRRMESQLSEDAAIYIRSEFELGVEREGFLPTPYRPVVSDSPHSPQLLELLRRNPSSSPIPLLPVQQCSSVPRIASRPERFDILPTEDAYLSRDNQGYGCLIQACQRQLPRTYKLSEISDFPSSCIGDPRTSISKRIQLHWHAQERPNGNSSSLWEYNFPVAYMDYKRGTAAQICRISDYEYGTMTSLGECVKPHSEHQAGYGVGVFQEHRQKNKKSKRKDQEKKGLQLLSIRVSLSGLGRFYGSESLPPKEVATYHRVKALVDRHVTASDRKMLEKVSKSPFGDVMSLLQESTPLELGLFLSNAKYTVHRGNKAGLHLLRVVLAERMLDARRAALGFDADPLVRAYRRDGLVVVPASPLNVSTAVRAQLLRLFQYAIGSATKIDERFTFHKVEVTHAALDTQHQMHMDTFSSITKVFGFAQAVTLKDGPFHYVKGSHRHSTKKLKLIKRLVDDDEFAACASPRVYPKQRLEQRFGDAAPVVVPAAGSIVVADTNGFHFRGAGKPGSRRDYYTTTWQSDGAGDSGGLPRLSPFLLS
jgi:hypothetical protein